MKPGIKVRVYGMVECRRPATETDRRHFWCDRGQVGIIQTILGDTEVLVKITNPSPSLYLRPGAIVSAQIKQCRRIKVSK